MVYYVEWSISKTKNLYSTVELWWLEHWWLFELVLESHGKNPIAADKGWFRVIFFFKLINGILCVLIRIAWGDSNENTQYYTIIIKKIEKISLLCHLAWHYDQHSLARTTPGSNIIIFLVPKMFEPLKFGCSCVKTGIKCVWLNFNLYYQLSWWEIFWYRTLCSLSFI